MPISANRGCRNVGSFVSRRIAKGEAVSEIARAEGASWKLVLHFRCVAAGVACSLPDERYDAPHFGSIYNKPTVSTVPKYIPKALLRPRPKPFLIWAAPPFLALYGFTFAAFATIAAFATQFGSILIGDQPVSDLGYLVSIYPTALLQALASVAAAYGLIVERLWVRPLLTKGAAALLLLDMVLRQLVANPPLRVLILEMWAAWLLLALSFWFFYRYKTVRAYYGRLERLRSSRRRDG